MKHKAAVIGYSYLAGLLCASFVDYKYSLIVGGLVAVIAALIVSFGKKAAGVPLLAAGIGAVVFALYSGLYAAPLEAQSGKTVMLTGTLTEKTTPRNDLCSYTISTSIDGLPATISFYSDDKDADYGDTLTLEATLKAFEDNANFAEKSYRNSKGVYLTASSVKSLTVDKAQQHDIISLIRQFGDYISDRISFYLPNDEGDMLTALFLGDKSKLSYELKSDIEISGISHMTAVSGLHLSLIAMLLMRLLTPLKYRRRLRYLILALFVLTFMVFFRLTPSVVRSGIMLLIFYGGEPLLRKSSAINSLGAAVLLITLISPVACLDMGFLLSVAGTFGIGVVAPAVCKRIPRNAERHSKIRAFLRALCETLIGACCANLCTIPLCIGFFGGFSLLSPIVGTLLTPLFFVAVAAMLLFTLTGGVFPLFALLAGITAKAIIAITSLSGELYPLYISIGFKLAPYLLVLAVILAAVVWGATRSMKSTAFYTITVTAVITILSVVTEIVPSGTATLELSSDGTDGCIFISQEGMHAAIVTDDSQRNLEQLYAYMLEYRVNSLDVLVLVTSKNNNSDAFKKLNSKRFVIEPSGESKMMLTDGAQLSVGENDVLRLIVNGITADLIPTKTEPTDGQILIFYGDRRKLPQVSGSYAVYLQKRLNCGGDMCANAYYNETALTVSETGIVERS